MPAKQRIPLFDNAKFILIALVVIGHFVSHALSDHQYARSVFVFIYSFHMPLFIFLSGLFINRDTLTFDRMLARALSFAALGFALKITFLITGVLLLHSKPSFNLLSDAGLPWFMFAIAAYYTLAWVLRKANPITVFVMSVLLALAVGYDSSIGDFLYLSRIIVYFPFFWIGVLLTPDNVSSFLDKKWTLVIGLCIIIGFAFLCVIQEPEIYSLRHMFTGRNGYESAGNSWVDRVLAYAIAACMCFAALAITPKKEIPAITTFGSRTMQVYALHYVVIHALRAMGVIAAILAIEHGWLLFLPLGIAVTLILSLKPFEVLLRPFTKLSQTRKSPSKLSKIVE